MDGFAVHLHFIMFSFLRSCRAGTSFLTAEKGSKDAYGVPTKHTGHVSHLRYPALAGALTRTANRRPLRQHILAASATGGARMCCHATGRASGEISDSATTYPVPLCAPLHARHKGGCNPQPVAPQAEPGTDKRKLPSATGRCGRIHERQRVVNDTPATALQIRDLASAYCCGNRGR